MKRSGSGSCVTLVVLAVAVILTACGTSPPVRYYGFAARPSETGTWQSVGAIDVALGPVRLANYLDRPEIATRVSDEELRFSEVNRWAGRLGEETLVALTHALPELLPRATVVAEASPAASAARYRVELVVNRFDGQLDGELLLDADWAVTERATAEVVAAGQSVVRQPVSGQSYDALVRAHGVAVKQLAKDVAGVVGPLLSSQ
ncbi:MAG: hypothetical protein AMJ69_05640 [Gammaproteobacteria bacterium SG8_47]|nr:MAG: hypothetical protein AMJ69_05640 [Gammaproteobacteria bacterium SG8_47]